MQTNNLKELSKLHINYVKVRSAKPGNPGIIIRNELDIQKEREKSIIRGMYSCFITERKEKLDSFMIALYGRSIQFEEKEISNALEKCHEVVDVTGLCFKDLKEFFHEKIGSKALPVDPEKIVKAYKALQSGCSKQYVKFLLN